MANDKKEDLWVENILRPRLAEELSADYSVSCKQCLLYELSIKSYNHNQHNESEAVLYSTAVKSKHGSYETDMLISQKISETEFIPLVVVEAKYGKMTTHAIITYNNKAEDHKRIHKNLLYGVVVANCKNGGLTLQKLYKHQCENFDFVFCFKGEEPTADEWECFVDLIKHKLEESQKLHHLLAGDKKGRDNFMCLEKQLLVKEIKAGQKNEKE